MKWQGEDWEDAFPVLAYMWLVNLILFMAVLWMGQYFIFIGHGWVEWPRHATLITLGMTKTIISVGIIVSLIRRFGCKGPFG